MTAISTDPLNAALRGCARGIYPDEAGVELLIAHAAFLHRDDFTSRFVGHATNATGTRLAAIDWAAAIAALDAGHLSCSGGEQRMLRPAASLASGMPVSLRDTLTGIDRRNIELVITACCTRGDNGQNQRFLDHLLSSEKTSWTRPGWRRSPNAGRFRPASCRRSRSGGCAPAPGTGGT